MENLELTFQAENQELTATNFTPPLFVASNTVAWIKAKFSLGTNWDCWSLGAVKAMWKFKGEVYSAVLDAEGVCTIPHEVLGEMTGEVKVNLVASSIEDDEVVERMTTYPLYALNVNKKAEVEGDNSVAITPSEYEQFVEDVQEYAQEAYDAKLDAESAQHYAEQAQEGAESAQRLAESARDDAQGYAESASGSADRAEQAEQSILGLSATAEVDANVGTPSVGVSVSEVGGNKVMAFDFHNLKGEQGETGEPAGFGTVSASVDANVGTPSVEVTASGQATARNFAFAFHNLKGVQGETGNGIASVTLISTVGAVKTYRITFTDGNHFDFEVTDGEVTNDILYSFLPTETTLKADIANFPDGADSVPMLSLIADIDPIQDLHGQDAPYPAGGGKNKLDSTIVTTGKYIRGSDGNVITSSDWVCSEEYSEIAPSTEYAIVKTSNSSSVAGYALYDSDKNYIDGSAYTNATRIVFTTPANAKYIRASWRNTAPNPTMVALSSVADDTYSPYSNICPISGRTEVNTSHSGADTSNPTVITTQLGQTVYGGTLDVVTGELVIDHAEVDMGDLNWELSNNGKYYKASLQGVADGSGASGMTDTVSSIYPYSISGSGIYSGAVDKCYNINSGYIGQVYGGYIYARDSDYATAQAFTTAMDGQSVVYKLATPITVQLTPTEVKTLLGENNVWADSGDVEVTYKADIQKYIDKQISAVLNA